MQGIYLFLVFVIELFKYLEKKLIVYIMKIYL